MDDECKEVEPVKKSSGNNLGTGILIGIIIALIFAMGVSWYLKLNNYQVMVYRGSSSSASSDDTEQVDSEATVKSKLNAIDQVISNYFLFDYKNQDLINGLYKGYVSGLGDVYTTYYTSEEYQSLKENTSGKYSGIGVKVQKEKDTDPATITMVFAESPAKEAGLEEGDQILKVEGKDTADMTLTEVVSTIRETKEGQEVTLTIYKAATGDTMEKSMKLEDVSVDTVSYKMLDNNIGYLQLIQFDEVSYDQFTKGIEELKKQGMKSLIIDLRNNPGGMLSTVVDIADYLLPEGLVVYTEDKNGNRQEYKSDAEHQFTMPMTVLINGNSASASEILAGAIKDYGTGTLIGTTTFGKGIVQNILSLGDGSAMKITTSKYYTPNGNYIHDVGIEPDIAIEQDDTTETDEQLDAAIKQLSK